MNKSKLDFEQEKIKHLNFKNQLRALLYDAAVEDAPIMSHCECTVGQWINEHAMFHYSHIPEIHQLENLHKKIHDKAIELVNIYRENRVEEARRELEPVEWIADHLISLLTVIELKLKDEDANPPSHLIERKKLEAAEFRYRTLIQELPLAMYTIDRDGYIDFYNDAALALWQRKPVLGKDRWCGSMEIYGLDKKIVPHEECPMAIALKENKTIVREVLIKRPDGSFRNVIVHPRPLHDQDGKIIGALKVLTDITDSKEQEIALRTSEEKFRVLSDSMPQFVWTGTPDGELNYYNQSVLNYSGFTLDELMNDGWLKIVHPEDREENIAKWIHSVQTGENFLCEHRFKNFNGEYRWQLSRAVAHRNADGDIQMWIGTSTDIQDQKTFTQDLERLVEDRTKQLQQANIQLESMNRELSSFAYISSHDLQEPLRKIQTFIGMIRSTDQHHLSDFAQANFEKMEKAAARMKKLINDLLTYSRTSAEERVFEPTDLNILLEEIKLDISSSMYDIAGKIHIAEMPKVVGIPFQLRQLFVNIISNAIKFARKDVPLRIDIKASVVKGSSINSKNILPDQEYHHITISDNGIGFDKEYAHKIFEVFQRLHGKEEYHGTGIGLAICKKIADNHKGVLMATGTEGQGATFSFYLPK